MESAQIVKRRLQDLKKLSLDLKQSTELNKQSDNNLIKAILSVAKNISQFRCQQIQSPTFSSSQRMRNQNSFTSSPQKSPVHSKTLSSSILTRHLIKSPSISKNPNLQQSSEYSLTMSTSKVKKISSNLHSPIVHGGDAEEQQMLHLREENVKLQVLVSELRVKLSEYQEKYSRVSKSMESSEENEHDENSSPFFRIKETVSAFYTRITVGKQDYQKVEYTQHNLQLTLDKLILEKSHTYSLRNSKNSTSILSSHQLHFINLLEIQYITNNCMLLVFHKENDQKISLFLHFQNSDALHRWDLGIFINYRIVNSLNRDKLFLRDNFQLQKNPQIESEKPIDKDEEYLSIQNQMNSKQEKQTLLKYFQNKKRYIESQKHLKKMMLNKITHSKSRIKNSENIEDQEIQKIGLQKLSESHKFSMTHQQTKTAQKIVQQSEAFSQKSKQRTKNNPEASQKSERKQTYSQNLNENISKQTEEIRLKKTTEANKRIQQNKMVQLYLTKLSNAISTLKKGIFMTKYSKSGFNPHQKKVFINQDGLKLCWQQKDSNSAQIKSIQIVDIQSVDRGEIGPGIQKHVGKKKNQINQLLHFNQDERKKFKSSLVWNSQYATNERILIKFHFIFKLVQKTQIRVNNFTLITLYYLIIIQNIQIKYTFY